MAARLPTPTLQAQPYVVVTARESGTYHANRDAEKKSRPVQRWIRATVLRSPVQNCHGPTKSTSRPPLMRIKPTPAGPIWIDGFGSMLQTKMRNEVLKKYNNQAIIMHHPATTVMRRTGPW